MKSKKYQLYSIFIINILDLIFTLYFIKLNLITEANPFMKTFIDKPIYLFFIKIVLVSLLVKLIHYLYKQNKNSFIIKQSINFITLGAFSLLSFHIYILTFYAI